MGKEWSGITELEVKIIAALNGLQQEAKNSCGWIRIKDVGGNYSGLTSRVDFFSQDKRPPETLFPLLLKDTKRVSMYVKTGVTLFSSYERNIINEIEKGCKFEFITTDESYVDAISGQLDLDVYRTNLDKTKQHLRRIRNKSKQGMVEVRIVNLIPTMGVILFDKKDGTSFVLVQEYFVSSRIGRDRPMFILRKGDEWYDAYREEVAQLWDLGVNWNI